MISCSPPRSPIAYARIASSPPPEGLALAPRWLTTRATRRATTAIAQPLSANHARLPQTVHACGGETGVVDLGADGLAVIALAGTVNLGLRTPDEQEALVGQLGGWLHTLRQPVQILVRATRLDLTGRITALRDKAEQMWPELADAARAHAAHLGELAATEDLLHRQVLLIWREPLDPATAATGTLAGPSARAILAAVLPSRRRATRAASAAARRAAEARLLRRMSEAAELLAPIGITVTGLDDEQATAILTSATNPGSLVPHSADIATPTAVITTGTGEFADGDDTDDEQTPDTTPTPRRARLRRKSFRGGSGSRFAPQSLTVGARQLGVGEDWVATLAVTGYPREVAAGWLAPLLAHPGRVDVAVHIDPVDPVTAATRLRRQMARLQSTRMHDASYGRFPDEQIQVAVEDAADLAARVARGEGRLFRVGLYVSVHAASEAELSEEVAAVRTLAASLLIDTCHLTYRAIPAWTATLPLGVDVVKVRRTFDTAALASAFPFTSPQLPATDPVDAHRPDGVLYGRDAAGGLLFWDRFSAEIHNHNAVVLGRSGAGKSYLVKTEVLRSLHRGIEALVIDPENEYKPLAEAVSGTYIALGAAGVRLNPFDLDIHTRADGRRTAPPDALTRRKLFLHSVIRVLIGDQSPAQRATLDTALTATYTAAGITDDPATWTRPTPTLSMLVEQLQACGSRVGDEVAAALGPFVAGGAFAGLVDGPTTTVPEGPFVVFSMQQLPDELKTLGTLLALDVIWRRVSNPALRRPRLVVVEEAWWMLRQDAGSEFLFKAAKSFRKYWAGLTIATQDVADVLGTEMGKAIVANATTQILLRQAPQEIDEVGEAFALSDGERAFLLSAARGQGLLATGVHRAVFASVASDTEDVLITTNPAHLTATGEDTDAGIDLLDADEEDALPPHTDGASDGSEFRADLDTDEPADDVLLDDPEAA